MPQIQLPFFPEGVTHLTPMLAFRKEDGQITYFNGNMPVFIHDEGDIATFRMITAQFCVNGNTEQAEIAKVFGIPLVTVKRAVNLYRQAGPKGFYVPRKARGAAVFDGVGAGRGAGMVGRRSDALGGGRAVGD